MPNRIVLENSAEFFAKLDGVEPTCRDAITDTLSDFRSRGPGWVAKEVSSLYAINQATVKGGGGKVNIHLEGSIDDAQLVYRGQTIHASDYSYGPHAQQERSTYTTKVGVYRGGKKKVGHHSKKKVRGGPQSASSDWLIMNIGGKAQPARRMGRDNSSIRIMPGPAIPLIVASTHSEPAVSQVITERAEERLMHNLDRYLLSK